MFRNGSERASSCQSQSSPLRVFHIVTTLANGGAQRTALDIVRLLDSHRFRTALAFGPEVGLLFDLHALQNTEIIPVPDLQREVRPLRDIFALRQLRRAIDKFQPDIVHTHTSKAGILGRIAARLQNVPLIIHTCHGYGVFGSEQPGALRVFFRSSERIAARWTTHFVHVSHQDQEKGIRLGLVPPQASCVIRSGIKLSQFDQNCDEGTLKNQLGIPRDAPVVVQISRFDHQKAAERFVQAAALIRKRVPSAHFILVGDGPLRKMVEQISTSLHLGDRLHLVGWRRDIPSLLSLATVATLTSRYEGLPRTVVEALAAGIPVAVMAVEGVAEVVKHGRNGYIVGAGDIQGLADHVVTILMDFDLRRRLAANTKTAIAEFDLDLMIHNHEQLYESLCRGRKL